MAQKHVPDSELIERLCQKENPVLQRAALDALYLRHDAELVRAIDRRLQYFPDHEELARQIANDLWLKLADHPEYLSSHDSARRPLASYLKLLARQEADHFRRNARQEQQNAARPLPKEGVVDPSAQHKITPTEWQEIEHKLGFAGVKLLADLTWPQQEKRPLAARVRKQAQRLREKIEKLLKND